MSAAERLVALFVAPVPVAPPDVAPDAAPGPGGGERPADAAPFLDEWRAAVPEQRTGQPALPAPPSASRPALRAVPDLAADDAEPESPEPETPLEVEPAQRAEPRTAAVPASVAPASGPIAGSARRPITSGARVCVLGGGRAGVSFAAALAARLAHLPGARCAVVGTAHLQGVAVPPRPPGPRARTASRVARALVADGHRATVRGRVVDVALPDRPDAVVTALTDLRGRAADAPTLTLLPGVRRQELDHLVADHDLLLVVVGAESSPALAALAVAELAHLAPHALVRAVPLPARLGASARRAAVAAVLEALR